MVTGESIRLLGIVCDQLGRILRLITAGIILFVMLLICSEVFTRYFVGFSILITTNVSVYIVIWASYLLVGELVRRDEHLKVDLLPSRLSGKGLNYLLILIHLALLYFSVLLGWGSIQGILMLKSGGGVTIAQFPIPLWIPYLCLPIGMFLVILGSLERIMQVVLAWRVDAHRGKQSS